jgi:hypothetical protein
MVSEHSVLREYLIPMLHRDGARIHTCATKSAFGEKDLGYLGEFVSGVLRCFRTHVAVPEVPRGLPKLVNVRGEHHGHGAA